MERKKRFGGTCFIHFITHDCFYHEGGGRTILRNAGTFFSERGTSREGDGIV